MKRDRQGRIQYPDWCVVGQRVEVCKEFKTKGGTIFKVGDRATITDRFKGVALSTDDGRSVHQTGYDNVLPVTE